MPNKPTPMFDAMQLIKQGMRAKTPPIPGAPQDAGTGDPHMDDFAPTGDDHMDNFDGDGDKGSDVPGQPDVDSKSGDAVTDSLMADISKMGQGMAMPQGNGQLSPEIMELLKGQNMNNENINRANAQAMRNRLAHDPTNPTMTDQIAGGIDSGIKGVKDMGGWIGQMLKKHLADKPGNTDVPTD